MSINDPAKIAVMLVVALMIGLLAGCYASRGTIKYLRRRLQAFRRGESPRKRETTKMVIWACLFNGFAWVWCSYLLAAMDKVQIAESLSQVALTEIIATVLAYCIKSAVENLSKNNCWPDKTVDAPEEREEPPDVGL